MKKQKKPLWRRIARGLTIAVASLVVLVVAAVGLLHTSWGKNFVRGRIEAKLAGKVNGTVSIGSLDYTFLFGEIHLGNVAIRDAQGRPAIGIAAIDVALDRSSLLHKDPLIDRLGVHGLDVSVIETADGGSNLKTLFKPSNDKPSIARLRVARLSLDGAATIAKPDGTKISVSKLALSGALEARPLAQELDATLAEIGAHLSIAKPGAAAKDVDLAIGSVTLGRRATSVDVRIAGVTAGPLGIDSLDAHAGMVAGRLAGEQKVAIAHARVDRTKLAALLGHELLRDDLMIEVTVGGPTNRLVLDGTIQTGATKLELDGEADVASARPAYRVALLGDGVQSSAVITKKPLPQLATDVRVELRGSGIKRGDVEAQLDLAIHALGVDVTGSGSLSRERAVAGNFSLKAEPAATVTAAAKAGIHLSPKLLAIKGQLPPRVELAISAEGRLDGELAVTLAPTKLAVARGRVGLDGKAVLDHGKLRTASANVSLASLDLAALSALAGKPPKAAGKLSGTLALTRDGARQRADYDLSVALAKPAVTLVTRGSADPSSATAHATISHAGVQLATLDAQLPLGKRAGKLGLVPSGNWKVAADLTRRPAAELAALLPEKLRAKLPKGDIEFHLDVRGTPANPTATLSIAATDAGKQISVASTLGPQQPKVAAASRLAPVHVADGILDIQQSFGASVETTVSASAPRITSSGLTFATKATIAFGGEALALVDANVAVPSPFASGAFDIKALRAGATLDATIDVPARSFGSLASLRPALARLDAKLGGQIDGHITARGPLAAPTLDATLRWFGYKTAAGTTGTTELVAYGTPTQLTAKITHGGALAIVAQIDRSAKDRIAISASAHAAGAPLLPLLPAFLAAKIGAHDPGHIHSEMYGSFALVRGPSGMKLEDVDVTGSFDITGASLAIPKSDRRYNDIGLTLAAEPHGLRITAGAHERDDEDRDRRIEANGLLAFENRKPATLDLSLVAHDWLLFGSQKLGPSDAPRAAADFDIAVAADLTKPIPSIDATVNSLTLRAPERFERGHYAETMSDDIIELEPGMTAGKLPVIVAVAAGEPANKKRHPMDIRVHIPKPIHLNQTPMDLLAHGELTVAVRDEGVKTRGVLTVDSGTLFLFGHDHDLVEGKLSFTDEHPHGWMEMTFERKLPDSTRRDQAQATPGARISFAGDLTKPKPTLSGAAGGLDEAMAMHNAGHGVVVTRPDMPASETVQAPRGDQLGVMTFLAGNLPKMTFLDRISAWSDPADSKYGQIKHVEAERYGAGDTTRVRAVVRPQQPGRSSAEIQVDRLLIHSDRAAAGVGVRAGDRLGGGVGFFVEWSSKD